MTTHRRRGPQLGLHWREFQLAVLVVDVVLIALTLRGSERIWAGVWPTYPPDVPVELWIAAALLLWLVALKIGGAYDLFSARNARQLFAPVIRAFIITVAATLGGYFFLPYWYPRSLGLVSAVVVTLVLFIWRGVIVSRLVMWRPLQRRLLLVGIDETTTRLASALSSNWRSVPYEPVAFVTDDPAAPGSVIGIPVVRGAADLWELVQSVGIHEIAVGRSERLRAAEQRELVRCFYSGVAASDAASLYEDLSGRVLVGHLRADWYSELPSLPRRPYFGVKRVLDLVGGLIALLVLSPVMLLVALAVLVDDGWPVLFKQVRHGRRGELFVVHKFRTMRRDAEHDGPRYALARDDRCTRTGWFLRPSGLDELPQLFDIIRGKMSLIGPRPERPEFVEQLSQMLPLYRARLLVRPGIVGWSEVQVVQATTLADHLVRLEYDLYYNKHASLILDINIALRAIGLIFSGQRWRPDEASEAVPGRGDLADGAHPKPFLPSGGG